MGRESWASYLPMSTSAKKGILVGSDGLNWGILVVKLSIVITSPMAAMMGDMKCLCL